MAPHLRGVIWTVPTTTHDIVRAYLAGHLSIRDFKAELANFAYANSQFLRDVSDSINDYDEGRISESQVKQRLKYLLTDGEDV
jgi:hypothetical protein